LQPVTDKIDRELIKAELNAEHFIRPTNNIGNEIYIFDGNTAPHLMLEVGRLREIAFREAGGGTGKSADIDEYDKGVFAYKQLIVWNPEDEEIIGGYRFALCDEAKDSEGNYHLSTSEIFIYTEKLKKEFFPYTIELGRSFVQPAYQPTLDNRKGLFSLDNLWDGLGALTVLYPHIKYFFGKVTNYRHFGKEARDHILAFMHYFFPEKDGLIEIPNPLKPETDCSEFMNQIKNLPFKEAHLVLNKKARALGEYIPPLFNNYMNLSPTMKTFGTAINHHFGDVEETGIMVTIDDIYPSKKDRHINSYIEYLKQNKINAL
jgi:hypothetical protein